MTYAEMDEIYEKYGIDVRLVGGPDNPGSPPEPALTSAGERAQAELLHELAGMRATLEMMEATVRRAPRDDRSFDMFDEALAQRMLQAHAALGRLRDRQDCQGAA